MTAPNEPTLNYGLRYARLYALNADSTPAATNTTPYEGVQIKGSTAFDLTFPEPRKITGLGEDSVTAVAYLPPNESVSGKLTVEADDPALAALITLNKVRTLGEASLIVAASSNQGFEPVMGLILSQAARGLTTGKNYWRSYILPSAMLVMQEGGMNADKSQVTYSIAPNVVSAHLWGEAIDDADEGAVSAQVVKLWSNHIPVVTSFVGTGTEDEFSFPVNAPSASTYATSTIVYVDGVKVPGADVAITATKITFDAGKEPALNARVDVFRELA